MSDGLWYAMPTLTGRRIRLEPLRYEQAADYLAAAGSDDEATEIFRWQSPPGGALARPVTEEDARRQVKADLEHRLRAYPPAGRSGAR